MAISSIGGCTPFLVSSYIPPPSTPPGRQCKYAGQSVRALPIRIVTVGKKTSPGLRLLVDEYTSKLKPYCSVDHIQIRSNPRNARDVRTQVEDEDKGVMNIIGSNDWVVMLDELGLDVGSEQMADLIGDAGNTGASVLSFCIGGPYGHGQLLRKRANVSIKLSSMVLNHQIALLVLIEQLYSIPYPPKIPVQRREFDAIHVLMMCLALQVMDYTQRTKIPPLVIGWFSDFEFSGSLYRF